MYPGDTTLTTNMLKSSLQKEIAGQLAPLKTAGLLPANYEPVVPMHSQSQTYATGPQINYRHFRAVTLFVHPDLGAIHETPSRIPPLSSPTCSPHKWRLPGSRRTGRISTDSAAA
jgi:hypothetical protein